MIGAVVFIALGLLLIWGSFDSVRRDHKSTAWPSTNAFIETSQKAVSYTDDGHRYYHDLLYRYHVGGVQYSGNILGWGSDQRSIESLVALYPEGAIVTVWFDPSQPRLATLEPGRGGGVGHGPAVGACMTLCGVLMAYFVARG